MDRRGFLKSILAAGVAPYVVTTAGVLMPVRQIARPDGYVLTLEKLRQAKAFMEAEYAANPPLIITYFRGRMYWVEQGGRIIYQGGLPPWPPGHIRRVGG